MTDAVAVHQQTPHDTYDRFSIASTCQQPTVSEFNTYAIKLACSCLGEGRNAPKGFFNVLFDQPKGSTIFVFLIVKGGKSLIRLVTGVSFPPSHMRSRTRAIATKESRTSPTRGSITPPFPSPPRTALLLSISSTTFASPTAESMHREPCCFARCA